MEIVKGRICISHAELTRCNITPSNINNLVRRKKVQRVCTGGNGREALFVVNSLPLKWRTEVYKRYPDLQEQAKSREFADMVEPDGAAFDYYQNYVLIDGRHLPEDKVLEYSNNAAIMNAFRRCWEAHVSQRQKSGKKNPETKVFWLRAAAKLPRLSDFYPHSLPGNPRRLKKKCSEYVAKGYECFISGKFLNNNAGKVLTEDQKSYLSCLLGHHNNLPDTLVAEGYNRMAAVRGWKEITSYAVGVWRKKLDIVTSAGRLGVTNFRNNKTMQVKRSRPTAPFLMWSLDGWTVELLYQSTKSDKKGHRVTTYTNRLTMVVVLDPSVDYPIGYAVGTHETPELIKSALRDAAQHSKELTGEMLRAYQIQSDRYAIKTLHGIYAVMGEHVTPAQAHNAKAKSVEPYFNYLNTTYCIRFNNFSGFGVTTNPKRQPNSEALNKLRHQFPDESGVRAQIDEIIRLERMTKRERFMSRLERLSAKYRLPLSREQYLLNFGEETGFKNVLEGQGLRPTILGIKRDYDCFDIKFREHCNERWTVMYDPEDLSQVLAVSEDGTHRFMLEQKYVQPMALADRKEGDAEQLERVRNFNKELESAVSERIAIDYQRSEQLITGTPAMRGSIEDRLLITDSKGQHKDQRSRKRLAAADIEAIDVETVEVAMTGQGIPESDSAEYETNDYLIF